jgi:hypothetical protein
MTQATKIEGWEGDRTRFSIFHFPFSIRHYRTKTSPKCRAAGFQMANEKCQMENGKSSPVPSQPANYRNLSNIPQKSPHLRAFSACHCSLGHLSWHGCVFEGLVRSAAVIQVIVSLFDIEAHLILTRRPEEKLYCLVINSVEVSPRRAS